jgi:DNA-binding NarL/FixJ family response regulator
MTVGWKIRVGLIDDHPLFRKGLAAALRGEADLEVVGEAGNAQQALALIASCVPDLVIIDVLMPETSGISITRDVFERYPRCRVLALSVIDEPCLIADMLRAGAAGFALKTQPVEEILAAIRQVAADVRYLPPTVSQDAVEAELPAAGPDSLGHLTRREREIFELVIRGFSNGAIATRLFIAVRTVETHRQRIMKKLAARSVAEMQRLAARHGGL